MLNVNQEGSVILGSFYTGSSFHHKADTQRVIIGSKDEFLTMDEIMRLGYNSREEYEAVLNGASSIGENQERNHVIRSGQQPVYLKTSPAAMRTIRLSGSKDRGHKVGSY
jgi:hypothetical protein